MPAKNAPPQGRRGWLYPYEASELLGVHIDTLADWEEKGIISSIKTLGGHNRYNKEQVEELAIHVQRRRAEGKNYALFTDDPIVPKNRQRPIST